MSPTRSTISKPAHDGAGQILTELFGIDLPTEGQHIAVGDQRLVMRDGILRAENLLSDAQLQTSNAFGFKWHQRDTFERPDQLRRVREWLVERYGEVTDEPWFAQPGPAPLLLDAGCGSGMSALELFAPALEDIRYLGIDVSEAVDVAAAKFKERGVAAEFLQSSLMNLPLPPSSIDIVFSEGVLHHTDSTQVALLSLSNLIRPGGYFLFYVYRRKGPIREFTDDYLRERLQSMAPAGAWEALKPLTRLGIALGELDQEIKIPEDIDLLDIPSGRMNLQRFFYWHVAKAFYRPDYTFDELHHINFDWYAPANAHRQTPDEVRAWCTAAGLAIVREVVEEAGITVIARKNG